MLPNGSRHRPRNAVERDFIPEAERSGTLSPQRSGVGFHTRNAVVRDPRLRPALRSSDGVHGVAPAERGRVSPLFDLKATLVPIF